MVKQPEREEATAAEESMSIEVGIVKADGTGKMMTKSNHFMHFKKKDGTGAQIDFGVLEFEVVSELVNEPLLVYFRGMN